MRVTFALVGRYAGIAMTDRMISIGPLAERRMKALGSTRAELRAVRWGPGAEVEGREFLRKYGNLPDGRRVVLSCAYDRPEHIVKFVVLSDDD
jgi:hypothetical protein